MTDTRTIDKIRKLLALANDKGASEHEAALAAERAQDLMDAHGLEMASLDLTGEGESREKGAAVAVGLGRETWAVDLMSAVAESCYVTAWSNRRGTKLENFTLIGRKSAVVSCEVLYAYLSRTVIRLSRAEQGSQRFFRFGCAERIAHRIHVRHAETLRTQRAETEARKANTQHSSSGGTALVVVLEDYAQKERDLNLDFQRGVAPGTSERERLEQEDKRRCNDARMTELQAQGISWDIAWWMVNQNMTLEDATAREAAQAKATDDSYKFRERVDFDARRRNSAEYHRGSAAGANVSLDRQLDADKRRIGND